ncbi:MAG: DndE family protein [Methylococcales bacterium]|nr:DndE family protein [Methylococcales bacterium]
MGAIEHGGPSSEADEVLSALRFETRLEKAVLARIAFAVSLVQDGKNVPESSNFSGGELKRPTFFGPDELFIRSLLAHVHGKGDIAEDAFFSNRSMIKNHIDQGSLALEQMYIESGRNADGLIKRLVDLVEFRDVRNCADAVWIFLSVKHYCKKPIWSWNLTTPINTPIHI